MTGTDTHNLEQLAADARGRIAAFAKIAAQAMAGLGSG